MLERSIAGLMTVLKPPAIIRLFESESPEKQSSKKSGSSLFGPYMFASVCECVSVCCMIDWVSVNGLYLFIKTETCLCLQFYAEEHILSNCLNFRCCDYASVKCVSCRKHMSDDQSAETAYIPCKLC